MTKIGLSGKNGIKAAWQGCEEPGNNTKGAISNVLGDISKVKIVIHN